MSVLYSLTVRQLNLYCVAPQHFSPEHNSRNIVFQNKPVSSSKSEILMSDLLFLIVVQEEEIPELEIDIDELLELTDEGQRSRLQVS